MPPTSSRGGAAGSGPDTGDSLLLDAYEAWKKRGREPLPIRWSLTLLLLASLATFWVGSDLLLLRDIQIDTQPPGQAEVLTAARQRRVPLALVRRRMKEYRLLGLPDERFVSRMLRYVEVLAAARASLREAGIVVPTEDLYSAIADAHAKGAVPSDIQRILRRVPADRRVEALTRFAALLQGGGISRPSATAVLGRFGGG